MNRHELHRILLADGIDPGAFDVLGGDLYPSETYVLRRLGPDRWATYYAERGAMTGLREHASEDEACRAFRAMIAGDGSARR